MQRGFSLVELSIVLVILGLLTGGILAGQSLIRASELRAVSTEHARWVTAIQSFRDKYFAMPGDFKDASRFWGRTAATADCVTNSASTVASPGACDGNGDGAVQLAVAASQSGEVFQFWRHLANAGLIEGSYTGTAGSGSNAHHIFGTNSPLSKVGSSSWGTLSYLTPMPGDANNYAGDYGNLLIFGGNYTNDFPWGANLKPEEAWNIDTKSDDGKPGTGKIMAHWRSACTDSTSTTDYSAGYKLSATGTVCNLLFPRFI